MTVTIGAAAIAGVLTTSSRPAAAAAVAMYSRTLALATLVTWLLDAGSGGYMLRTWIVRGGLRRQRSSDRLGPRVVFTHFGMASTGLLIWLGYLATRWIVLAWLAVGMLTLVIGLGVSTVTLWTPFPAHRAPADAGGSGSPGDPGDPGDPGGPGDPAVSSPGEPGEDTLTGRLTDEMLTRALTDDVLLGYLVEDVVTQSRTHPRKRPGRTRAHAATLIPAGHGMAAIATMILAVLTTAGATR
jgi:manganese efflux pump family protein